MVKVEDFFYIPSKMDPSDPATRSKYSLADLGQGSEWQQPNFLFSPRRAWPISSDSLDIPFCFLGLFALDRFG